MAKPRRWKPLAEEHKNDLIGLVLYGQNLARQSPSMKRLAVYLIKVAGWRWTADAVDETTDVVIPDAIKYDIRYLPHTAEAARVTELYPKEVSRRLTHEHTVPLSLIADWVLQLSDNREAVRHLFDNCCRAAILTREEDQKLNAAKLRSSMPPDWNFESEITARYKSVEIELIGSAKISSIND